MKSQRNNPMQYFAPYSSNNVKEFHNTTNSIMDINAVTEYDY